MALVYACLPGQGLGSENPFPLWQHVQTASGEGHPTKASKDDIGEKKTKPCLVILSGDGFDTWQRCNLLLVRREGRRVKALAQNDPTQLR